MEQYPNHPTKTTPSESNLHSRYIHNHRISLHPSLRRSITKQLASTTTKHIQPLRPTHIHLHFRQQWVSSRQASNTAVSPTPLTPSEKASALTKRAKQPSLLANICNSRNSNPSTMINHTTIIPATCIRLGAIPLAVVSVTANQLTDWRI